MQRALVFGLVLLVTAILGVAWLFSRGETAPPPPSDGPTTERHEDAGARQAAVSGALHDAAGRAVERQIVAAVPAALRDDPEIQAGLCGWRGRVVDHARQPVPGCGVRLYRGALDSVLVEGLDLFADEPTFTPQYVAGDTKTAEDGRFEFHGVWPRGFYILFAGIGTDAPMHQLLTRTPSPGEIVDLGDVVLPDAGVITGTVVDESGDPIAGALVRAADLPGTLAAFFPVERFDPEGALLIREPQSPVRVLEMPKWVKPAFDELPIPSTRSGADGTFRLVGIVPGSNLLATTQRGYLSDMKPSVQVRAGQVKDVGRVRLRRGEDLSGRVVDGAGKPVAGAEILAGSTLSMAPVDLAQRIGTADADGRFEAQGFAPGKVTVAARRGKGHPWVLAEPQPVAGDVVVTLPAMFAVEVAVTLPDGTAPKEPRFRLLQGKAGNGAAEMHLLGFAPPIDLRDRRKSIRDGIWRLENLLPGAYTLAVDAPGYAIAHAGFELATADAAVKLQLVPPKAFAVRVVGHDDKPVRNARIYAESRGRGLQEMPSLCGRTDADGRLAITTMEGDTLRVSAEHPRWGVVHGEVKPGDELVLRMQAPGSLRGTLLEDGKPPAPGKFSIALMRHGSGGPRGPLEDVPTLLTANAEGAFAVAALQPGNYRLAAVKALDALRSPGGVFGMMQDMFLWRDVQEVDVEVIAGQEAIVVLEAGEKPIQGPTGTIAGSVTVDGKLAVGYSVTAHADGRRAAARVDERGRFDLGVMPVGHVWVQVQGAGEAFGMSFGGSTIWSTGFELKQAEAKELTIAVQTTSMAGVVRRPDGSPAAGVFVQARGRLKTSGGDEGDCWLGEATDTEGRFRFAQVPEGTWTLEVRTRGARPRGETGQDPAMRGDRTGIAVVAGLPIEDLRIDLVPAIVVQGRVDMAAFKSKPRWVWLGFYRIAADTPDAEPGEHAGGAGVDEDSGAFSTDELIPGRYRVRIYAQLGEQEGGGEHGGMDIDVPAGGLTNVVLTPRAPGR